MEEAYYVSDGTVTCKVCGKEVAVVYIDRKLGSVCSDCMLQVKPPQMVIVDASSSGELYNVQAGKYEFSMTIEDMEKCGWHVAEISQRDVEGVTRTAYLLKYYGNKKCGRFPMYGYWGLNAFSCHLNNCISLQPPDSRAAAQINKNHYMT